MSTNKTHGKTWAMVCHLATFAGWIIPLGNILGPLAAWLVKREEHPHINDQGKEAVNFNISITIYGIVLMLIMFGGVVLTAANETTAMAEIFIMVAAGILGLAIALFHFIFTLIAAYRAYHGVNYRYPLTIRFIK